MSMKMKFSNQIVEGVRYHDSEIATLQIAKALRGTISLCSNNADASQFTLT